MKTIIVGLGNPILSDDSVGIRVAREINSLLGDHHLSDDVDVTELYAGGIRLIDALSGYDCAVIVDAMTTGLHDCGAIRSFEMSELGNTRNTVSMHDMDLPTALEMACMLGIKMPSDIIIMGIEARDVCTFSEELTIEVAEAVPVAVARIIDVLLGHVPGRLQ